MSDLANAIDRHDSHVLRLEAQIQELRTRFEAASVDVDRLRLSPKLVAAIVVACIGIWGANYASNSGLRTETAGVRSDVRDIKATIENQKRLDEVNQKLSDQKTEDLRSRLDVIDKRQQLQQIEIQDLKEMVLRQGAK